MDIGADLRKARIARNRSIEDISQATKISSSVLRSIEREEFGKIPGGLFTRGYLRAYAKEVGLEPDEIIGRYRAEFDSPEPPPDVKAGQERATAPPARSIMPVDDPVRAERTRVVELVVIAGVAIACFALLRQAQPVQQDPAPRVAAEVPAAAPRTTDVPVATSGRNTVAPSQLKVDIHPQGPCWVEATADGERVVAKLMNAGDQQSITVREDVMLRVGDPGAFAFSIDGAPGRAFGQPGQPAWIRITRQNYETFVVPQ